MVRKKQNIVIAIILLAVYIVFQYKRINLDFWNDELYTLKNFVFVPFNTVVSDYHAPNNHVFFNLVLKCYLWIINVDSLSVSMDRPYLLRLLPFLFSLGTFTYLYAIAKKFFSEEVGQIGLVILITSIPFFNFSLQLRGYGLSLLLIAALIYYTLKFRNYRTLGSLLAVSMSVTLLLYTISSNFYFIIGFWLVCFLVFTKDAIQNYTLPAKNIIATGSFQLLIAVTMGTILCFALYLPVLGDVFYNEYVRSSNIDLYRGLKIAQVVTLSFLSRKYLLVAVLIVAALSLWRKKVLRTISFNFTAIAIFLYIFPFIINTLRGDPAPPRIFVNLVPLFTLTLAISVVYVIKALDVSRSRYLLLFASFLFYGIFVFIQQEKRISDQLLSDIHFGGRSQDIFFNYYLEHYHPKADLNNYIKRYGENKSILVLHDSEPHGLPYYLNRYNLGYFKAAKLDSILATEPSELFIITRYPHQLRRSLGDKQNAYEFEMTGNQFSYHNFIRLYKIK